EEERADHDPDVFDLYHDRVTDNVAMMRRYAERVDDSLTTTVHHADSRTATDNGERSVQSNSADIVITSPPYGDHQT
ncbi:MAG: adenine-specific DNA methylase, partial [Halobacteriaceae archaeon]